VTRPDPIVSEETGRAAIDRVIGGVVETQRGAGVPLPGGRAVEDWARDVVVDTIRRHEERMAQPDLGFDKREAPPGESPARIDRGDVGPNAAPVFRDLDESPRGRQHLNPLPKSRDLALLDGRMELLRYFPCGPGCSLDATDAGHFHPWGFSAVVEGSGVIRKGKLANAVDEAVVLTRRIGWTDDDPKTITAVADAIMRVVELSAAPPEMGGLGLGDYKELRREMYVRLPRRGGLVPLSQLPKHAPEPGAVIKPTGIDT
jgi:hypothetical protein